MYLGMPLSVDVITFYKSYLCTRVVTVNFFSGLSECQQKRKDLETGPPMVGAYKPSCEEDGTYSLVQCHGSTGYCWCAYPDGTEWPGTRVRGQPDCSEKESKLKANFHCKFKCNFLFFMDLV